MDENGTTKTKTDGGVFEDEALTAVPLDKRQHWITPAMIFGGLEFCIPVIMIGSILIGSFSMGEIIILLLLGFVLYTWPTNTIAAYIGAKTGLASSVLAKSAFGEKQARYGVAGLITLVGLGHWSMQTAVAGNAICAMFGIDYLTDKGMWAIITIVAGLIFCIPAVIGYKAMKWTDYIAVPSGLILCIVAVVLAIQNIGIDNIVAYQPPARDMTFLAAFNLIISLNTSQMLLAADYSRYARPRLKDSILLNLGIVAIGPPLIIIGALMAVGSGSADIVQVMINLGMPIWGFLVLWVSTWTSQIVNNYSAGLSLANLLNIKSAKGRSIATVIATLVAIGLALTGILNHIDKVYEITGLCMPAVGSIIFVDFFMRKKEIRATEKWNYVATIAVVASVILGYITTYVAPWGIPALQSLILSVVIYYLGMKGKIAREHKATAA
ncbi:permease [Ruminococcaceae bacterium OttesenSCG-928-D13]|nr:permease [Ruminococcaceae bacterium OttesenSCG-928-D13]